MNSMNDRDRYRNRGGWSLEIENRVMPDLEARSSMLPDSDTNTGLSAVLKLFTTR